jgi:hypothetical protein
MRLVADGFCSARTWTKLKEPNEHMKLNPPKLFLFTWIPDFIFMLHVRRLRLTLTTLKGVKT